ncbi:MAG: cupin domain-containing protein [Chlamydiota bacterium]
MIPLLLMTAPMVTISDDLTIYSLVPPEARVGWKLELFCLSAPVSSHYHKIQKQWIVVVDGSLTAVCGRGKPTILQSSHILSIDPGTQHALIPEGTVRFFAIDLPAFDFPEDVFYDNPEGTFYFTPFDMKNSPPLLSQYFGERIDKGYGVYNLVEGIATEDKWSAALVEIEDSSHKHFHKIETEVFVVVQGTLNIEISGVQSIVEVGEAVTVHPGNVHQLKSAGNLPLRVLCFNFPAFNPEDIYTQKNEE